MAKSAPGTAFYLLLLTSIIQGNPGPHLLVAHIAAKMEIFTMVLKCVLASDVTSCLSNINCSFVVCYLIFCLTGLQDVKVFHYEKMEAVVGQDVVLPCTVHGHSVFSIEWRKNINEITKLALYSLRYGVNLFWPNISMQIENETLGSNLHLPGVSKWDSGVYICDITTFPLGTISRETQLEIKGKMGTKTCRVIPSFSNQSLQSAQDLTFGLCAVTLLSNCP